MQRPKREYDIAMSGHSCDVLYESSQIVSLHLHEFAPLCGKHSYFRFGAKKTESVLWSFALHCRCVRGSSTPYQLLAAPRLKTDLGSASFAPTLYTGKLAKPNERLIYIQLPDKTLGFMSLSGGNDMVILREMEGLQRLLFGNQYKRWVWEGGPKL